LAQFKPQKSLTFAVEARCIKNEGFWDAILTIETAIDTSGILSRACDNPPTSGPAITINDSIVGETTANGTFSTTLTKPLGPLNGAFSFSGSITPVGFTGIAFASPKGGVGKTTATLTLAGEYRSVFRPAA
jgi:Mrp family chromosome partitioning ATPase